MILLNPGPVNVTERVRKALLREDICHREEEFSRLLASIRLKLIKAFTPGDAYTAVVLTGSGTAAVEAAVSGCLEPDRKLLVLNNGVYGERIGRIAGAYGLNQLELKFDWRQRLDLYRVEQALAREPAIQVVAMVHHETTTGLLNPVDKVAKLARQYGKKLLVDSVSGLGGEDLRPARDGVDLCVGTSGKCIQGFPGVSFVLVKNEEMKRLQGIPQRTVYLSLPLYYQDQEDGTIPFTPAVQLYYALDEALEELLEEGVEGRQARYREAARFLREGFQKLGLDFVLTEPDRSNSITSLYLPADVSYRKLHDEMKQGGYVIYAGQGGLEGRIFRVANMGALQRQDLEGFLGRLESALG